MATKALQVMHSKIQSNFYRIVEWWCYSTEADRARSAKGAEYSWATVRRAKSSLGANPEKKKEKMGNGFGTFPQMKVFTQSKMFKSTHNRLMSILSILPGILINKDFQVALKVLI
jgi:hypothetical protein